MDTSGAAQLVSYMNGKISEGFCSKQAHKPIYPSILMVKQVLGCMFVSSWALNWPVLQLLFNDERQNPSRCGRSLWQPEVWLCCPSVNLHWTVSAEHQRLGLLPLCEC